MSSIIDNFVINANKYVYEIEKINIEFNDEAYELPVYIIDQDKLVNEIINKVAQTTDLSIQYNINPATITYYIRIFNDNNGCSVEKLNEIIQKILKYKEFGINLLLFPYIFAYDTEDEQFILHSIDMLTENHRLICNIVNKLFNTNIRYYDIMYYNKNSKYLYLSEFALIGIIEINNIPIRYSTFYPIEVELINHIIQINLKKPKQINISKDSNENKYLISWEY